MEKPLTIDVETTIFQKGNPFARRNKLCYVGSYRQGGTLYASDVGILPNIQREITDSSLLVGFNIKYDLHWLRRAGVDFSGKRVWDVQFAHFLLSAQRVPWWENSLDNVCRHYGISGKLGGIAENYWDKGIDTPDIPIEEMCDYLGQDLRCTMECYRKQRSEIEKDAKLLNLFRLHMDDLLVLQEMEYNGVKWNEELCKEEEKKVRTRIEEIDGILGSRYPNVSFNWDSGDHCSIYLYGGTITVDRKEPIGLFKTGSKIGQVRYKWYEDYHHIPRLIEPLENSKLKKEGYWSTAEDVLAQVKQINEVKLLRERSKLTKLLDYFVGFPELERTKDWTPGVLHGQFNQNRVVTGRLSSSDPNLQNLPDPVLKLIESRYGH